MKILFAGQLDRVFANEFAISVGPESDDHWDLDSVDEQKSADSRFFHMAGTLAALSDELISLPYVSYARDTMAIEDHLDHLKNAANINSYILRTQAMMDFDLVANDALELAKVCALIGQLAARSDAVLDEVDTEEAWIGHYHALKHLHGDHGPPLAYLAGLLMQAYHACEMGAVFVLAECDRLILADLGAMIVRKRWPRPFAIPDLRYLGPPYNKKNYGSILNLGPTDIADLDAFKLDPGIQAYAEAVGKIVSGSELSNIGSALAKATNSARGGISNDQEEIGIVVANVRMFSNAGTVAPAKGIAWYTWSQRHFATRILRTIVLV